MAKQNSKLYVGMRAHESIPMTSLFPMLKHINLKTVVDADVRIRLDG